MLGMPQMGTRGREVFGVCWLLSPSVVLACPMQLLALTVKICLLVCTVEGQTQMIMEQTGPFITLLGCLVFAKNSNASRLLLAFRLSNKMGLEAAVEATAEFLNKAVKSVLVGGPKLRVSKACDAFVELLDACGYALALMPSVQGPVPEHLPHFIGTYWVAEEKAIILQPDRVSIANGPAFGRVLMKDFLKALSKQLKCNTMAYDNYHRIYVPEGIPLKCEPKEALRGTLGSTARNLNCLKDAVGATLGYAQAVPENRVNACIGDGSFQVCGVIIWCLVIVLYLENQP
ncbi:hypothetical protein Patl1_31386 [Pistacia atlantica]|uniref:Uncharacterized protein n=1 Tax=Pistacia atlantica TaxID=434234 RepID=A0ACC1ANT9_9ROSI|nr:hypothetical protein Patl1_31386 [Pistacia atlantica]